MFSRKLISWFSVNKRDLPWRQNKTFYRVWISEIMLQQTQVNTVIDFYLKFILAFPTITDLANAPIDKVLKTWEGLGYYSRARNLHKAAKYLTQDLNNNIPMTYDSLIKIPGFGPYTTAAVLSLTFNQNYAVVDGNVKRVISRFYGMYDDIKEKKTHDKIQYIVNKLLPIGKSALFNEAIMEFGATICTKTNPKCNLCVVRKACKAFELKIIDKIPISAKKKKIQTKYYIARIAIFRNSFSIMQRPTNEMLGGLWGFNFIEIEPLSKKGEKSYIAKNKNSTFFGHIKHSYSHFKIDVLVETFKIRKKHNSMFIKSEDFHNFAFDSASHKIWEKLINNDL